MNEYRINITSPFDIFGIPRWEPSEPTGNRSEWSAAQKARIKQRKANRKRRQNSR